MKMNKKEAIEFIKLSDYDILDKIKGALEEDGFDCNSVRLFLKTWFKIK